MKNASITGEIHTEPLAARSAERPPAFLADLVETFLRFEIDNELFALNIRGRTFWDYIRYRLFEELVGPLGGFDSPALHIRRRSIVLTCRALAMYAVRAATDRFAKGPRCDVILVSNIPGRYWRETSADVYMHPIACVLRPRWRTLVFNHYDQNAKADDYVCDVIHGYPDHLANSLRGRFASWSPSEVTAFTTIGMQLHQQFGVRVDVPRLARRFAAQVADEQSFGRVLERTQPAVMVYCDNGSVKGLVRAAHHHGVRAVELQHGAMSLLDVRYRYDDRVTHAAVADLLPDEILTFGEYWSDQHALPATSSPVGLPALELWRSRPRRASPVADDGVRSKRIVVVSVLSTRRDLARVALDLATRLPDFDISFKLRHDEFETWRADYPPEFQTTANLSVIGRELSLHECLSRNAYQVGTNSTALYEGMYFGLTTFVLAAGRYEEMMPVIAHGGAFLVSHADEIADAVRGARQPPHKLDGERLFRSSSLSHIEQAIAEILQESSSR